MGNNDRRPKIRFKGFNDDWEQRYIEDIASFSKGNGYSKSDLSNNGNPIILYGRLYTNYEFCIDKVNTYSKIKKGSVLSQGNEVIVPSSGETSEDIARASAIIKKGILIGGDLNIIRPIEIVESCFLALAISNGKTQKDLSSKAQGKSVVHIHNSDIKKIQVSFPKVKEQEKIIKLFKFIDNLISLHQRKLEKLGNIKKSMLEKMFPKDENKVPEIRFKGFNDDWEQHEFGEIFKLSQGLQIPISKRYLEKATNRYFYITNEFLKDSCEKVYYIESPAENVICTKDDILMTRTGNTGIVITDVEGCFHNNFFKIQYNKDLFSKNYICYLLKSEKMKKKILNSAGSSTIPDLSHKSFYKIDAKFPILKEQYKIGEFFKQLDSLIVLHQRKLEKLKNIKKACLEKMFV